MFDLFKKKLKEAVSKITGKIEEETKIVEETKTLEKVPEEKKATAHEKKSSGRDLRSKPKAHGAKGGMKGKAKKNAAAKKEAIQIQETKTDSRETQKSPTEQAEVKAKEELAVTEKKETFLGKLTSLFGKKKEEPKIEEVILPSKDAPSGFLEKITRKITHKELTEDFLKDILWDLELVLLENNVASDVAEKIINDIKENLKGRAVSRSRAEAIIEASMATTIQRILDVPSIDIEKMINENKKNNKPTLIMVLGFNGSGKTTSLAKLGHWLQKNGHSVVFAAGDTYRAAAIDQLEIHAHNLGAPIIKTKYGADSAAVIFDAVKHAKSKGIEVVLADTAGRAHTDANLVNEMKKIVRVNNPDLKILVVESVTGNDVLEQARVFDEVNLDGIILAKWDVDEKGGAALSLCHSLKKPILFLGVGQEYNDFKEFDVDEAVKNIF